MNSKNKRRLKYGEPLKRMHRLIPESKYEEVAGMVDTMLLYYATKSMIEYEAAELRKVVDRQYQQRHAPRGNWGTVK